MGNDPDPVVNSHSYALRNSERTDDSLQPSNIHDRTSRDSEGQVRSRAEQPYPTSSESLQISSQGRAGPGVGPATVISEHPTNFNTDASATEIRSSQILDFQNMETDHLAGGSSFDLNMVDLFGGSDFDSLLDMMGQQYPSF